MPAEVKKRRNPRIFHSLLERSISHGEQNDCTVIAVAAATGVSYEKAHTILKFMGRKDGSGCSINQVIAAITMLGFRVKEIDHKMMMELYPHPFNKLETVNTDDVKLLPQVYRSMPPLLFLMEAKTPRGVEGHIQAVVDGEIQCFMADAGLAVEKMFLLQRVAR